ncbi:MAG: type II toxin-antitoxin system VapC family toxin [Pyrinomonadaceae bacterium]
MKGTKAIVLDSWAIMAFLQDEPTAVRIADIMADARDEGVPLLMSVINAGEVWYTVARRRSSRDADQALRWLQEIGIDLVDADLALTQTAAQFKAKGGISYADCFASALAKLNKATLITGDSEFKQLEKEIEIVWL